MPKRSLGSWFCFSLMLSACATSAADSASIVTAETEEIEEDGDMLDPSELAAEPAPLVAALPELSVEMARVGELVAGDGGVLWRFRGRTSRALTELRSWVPDDAFAAVEVLAERRFEITVRDASEQNTLLSGMPLFVSGRIEGGREVSVALWLQPRLAPQRVSVGESRLRYNLAIRPIWVGGDVVYRGRVSSHPSFALQVFGSPSPATTALGAGRVRLDWSFDALREALSATSPKITAVAVRGAQRHERAAKLGVQVGRLGVTVLDPQAAWPVTCEPSVRACLRGLPLEQQDTEACGSYRQVLACGGPAGARQ